ncbi:MAG: hypothetical protein H0W25_03265 [Acidimicrobiia bacterium]|nr:hypothetical protein [Acidimicrobiia bacterium]
MAPPAASSSRPAWLVPAAVAVALVVGVVVGALVFGGDDGDPVSTPSTAPGSSEPGEESTTTAPGGTATTAPVPTTAAPPPSIPIAGLEGDALALAEAINRAGQLTYRATYRTPPGVSDQITTVEVYRRLPFARRDTYIGEGEQALHTAEFLTPDDGHVGCLVGPEGSNETFCIIAPTGGVDPSDPVIGAIDPTAGTVTAADETVAGVEARCFRATTTDGVVQVACFDSEGIPVVLDGGDGRLERVLVERAVPDDVFVVPSQPAAAPPGPTTPAPTVAP